MLQLFPHLVSSGQGKPALEDVVVGESSGPACFEKMSFEDSNSWAVAAGLVSVATYLRGNRNLNLPAAWRAVLPTRL